MGQGHPVDGGADAGACGHGLGDGADLDGDVPRCNLRQMAGREQPKQGAAEPVCVWPLELSMASGVTTVTDLSTSTDSPVRADSSTHKSVVSIRRRSAGTMLPVSSITASPGTSENAEIRAGLPWGSTVLIGVASFSVQPGPARR